MQPQQVLFALLRQEICENAAVQEFEKQLTKEELEAVFKLSNRHDLAHIAGQGLEKNKVVTDETILSEFQTARLRIWTRCLQLRQSILKQFL